MSGWRMRARVDASQTSMVTQLRAVGIQVWIIRQPCDLLLRFWCNRHHDFCWQPMEAKTLRGKRSPKARIDTRQIQQIRFLAETSTPTAGTFEEAWRKLNQRHSLGRIESPQPLQPIREIA